LNAVNQKTGNTATSERQRLRRFIFTGCVGFVTDAFLLYLFSGFAGPFVARIGSFIIAVLVTWRLNVVLTFGHEGKGLLHYLSGQTLGIALNYLTYSSAVLLLPETVLRLLIALTLGSSVAMIFNYLAMKHWIFRT